MTVPGRAATGRSGALVGHAVLVTRPQHQAEHLCHLIEAEGGVALRFPLLEIVAAADPEAARRALASALVATRVVFVSANAVRESLTLMPEMMRELSAAQVAAIGGGTARALAQAGLEAEVATARGTRSEDLLTLPMFAPRAVRGHTVAVVRGEGGRELLEQSLRSSGAHVIAAAVYRRIPPRGDLASFLTTHAQQIALAIVTSGEALRNLRHALPVEWQQQVLDWPLVLPSERVVELARELGFTGPLCAVCEMCDEALVASAARLLA